jgi:hypothetical protein
MKTASCLAAFLCLATAHAEPTVAIQVREAGTAATYQGEGVLEFADPAGVWSTTVAISPTLGFAVSQYRDEVPDLDIYETCAEGTLPREILPPPAPITPPLGGEPGTPLPFTHCPFGFAPSDLMLNGERVSLGWAAVYPTEGGYDVHLWRASDHDMSGATETADMFAYLSDYFAGTYRADRDRNGVVDMMDFNSFLAAWFAGE